MPQPAVAPEQHNRVLAGFAIVLLALNLRTCAVSIAPVLHDIQDTLGMTATAAGVLTTLPVLCFSGFAVLGPWFSRVLGAHRTMAFGLLLSAVGMFARSVAGTAAAFIALTIPVLAAGAVANVLLPSLVKLHFPTRIGLMTGLYTTALAVGQTLTSALTVPAANITGSWRGGLATWGGLAALSAIPWLWLLGSDRDRAAPDPDGTTARVTSLREISRTPLGWWMAVCFGIQSIEAYAVFGWLPEIYRPEGFSAETRGLLLALATGIAIPISLAVPSIAVRMSNQALLVITLCTLDALGFVGLILIPGTLPWLWAVLIGAGMGMFPLCLTFVGLRSRTSDGTAGLSGFMQSVGYLIAAVGPLMMGILFDATGSWTIPVSILLALTIPLAYTGIRVSRPAYIEDQLGV